MSIEAETGRKSGLRPRGAVRAGRGACRGARPAPATRGAAGLPVGAAIGFAVAMFPALLSALPGGPRRLCRPDRGAGRDRCRVAVTAGWLSLKPIMVGAPMVDERGLAPACHRARRANSRAAGRLQQSLRHPSIGSRRSRLPPQTSLRTDWALEDFLRAGRHRDPGLRGGVPDDGPPCPCRTGRLGLASPAAARLQDVRRLAARQWATAVRSIQGRPLRQRLLGRQALSPRCAATRLGAGFLAGKRLPQARHLLR